tara:strand:+ start:1746 stop:2432 length:687 start_codon:yes stop_codon:yes gene_type:complete
MTYHPATETIIKWLCDCEYNDYKIPIPIRKGLKEYFNFLQNNNLRLHPQFCDYWLIFIERHKKESINELKEDCPDIPSLINYIKYELNYEIYNYEIEEVIELQEIDTTNKTYEELLDSVNDYVFKGDYWNIYYEEGCYMKFVNQIFYDMLKYWEFLPSPRRRTKRRDVTLPPRKIVTRFHQDEMYYIVKNSKRIQNRHKDLSKFKIIVEKKSPLCNNVSNIIKNYLIK